MIMRTGEAYPCAFKYGSPYFLRFLAEPDVFKLLPVDVPYYDALAQYHVAVVVDLGIFEGRPAGNRHPRESPVLKVFSWVYRHPVARMPGVNNRAGEIDTSVEENYTALTDRSKTYLDPVVVDHYATYWIVRWLSAYYVMPKQHELSALMLGERSFPSISTQEEALSIAKEETHRRGADWLAYLPMQCGRAETIKNYPRGNLILWDGMYIFLRSTKTHIDLFEVNFNELPPVLYDAELKVIRKRIAWKLLGHFMSLGLYWRQQTGTSSSRGMWPRAAISGSSTRRPTVSKRRP